MNPRSAAQHKHALLPSSLASSGLAICIEITCGVLTLSPVVSQHLEEEQASAGQNFPINHPQLMFRWLFGHNHILQPPNRWINLCHPIPVYPFFGKTVCIHHMPHTPLTVCFGQSLEVHHTTTLLWVGIYVSCTRHADNNHSIIVFTTTIVFESYQSDRSPQPLCSQVHHPGLTLCVGTPASSTHHANDHHCVFQVMPL